MRVPVFWLKDQRGVFAARVWKDRKIRLSIKGLGSEEARSYDQANGLRE
jgi:hypothetical protein